MNANDSAAIVGRKTFVVGVDPNSFPEAYLETLMANGFETYQISADGVCPMDYKIEMISTLFKGSIMLFYIDAQLEGISWPLYIRDYIARHGGEMFVGVLYTKRGIDSERMLIESAYTQLGVSCGCTPLGYQKAANLQILCNLLLACGANGRRKVIRTFCNATSEVSFTVGTKKFRGPLKDISLSHFSCLLEQAPDHISLNQHFTDVQLLVNGSRFRSNAELVMQREVAGTMLSIFVFNKADKTAGLGDDEFFKLSPKIYQMVTDPVKERMRECFFMLNRFKGDKCTMENKIAKVLVEMRKQEAKKAGRHSVEQVPAAPTAPAVTGTPAAGGDATTQDAPTPAAGTDGAGTGA